MARAEARTWPSSCVRCSAGARTKRMVAVLTVPSPLVRAPAEQRTQLLGQVRASARAIEDGLRTARR